MMWTPSLLLALVCILGALHLSAFAAEGASAPAYVTQKSADYWRTNGRLVRYQSASSTINNAGRAHVFDAQVSVPGLSGTTRALCSHHIGTLGSQANGQKWNYRQTVDNASLKVLLTYVYSHTNGNFTDAGKARGLETWGEFWSDLWYITAQTMTWYWEYGLIKDVTTDREGFIEQASEEMIISFKVIHDVWNFSPWIKDWDNVTIHTIIDSKVTISLTSQSKPQPPLYGFVYGNTRPYSQTRSNTQRELMQPDEILRLDRRQCIALFQGRKPALLYKLTPEELPGYDTLKSCRVADYTPEWRQREEQEKVQASKKPPPPDVPGQEPPAPPKQPAPEDEPDPSQDLEYQINGQSLGMVELGPDGVVGGNDEDEESPPGR